MPIVPIYNRPGIGAALDAFYGRVFRADEGKFYFPTGGLIDGLSRYYAGTTNLLLLPPGLLMGQATSTKKWLPTVIGTVTVAYTSGGTSLTALATVVTELVRRNGASGTFTLKGAATAAGTLTSDTVTYSAASGTTITVTNIGANRIAGSIITAGDGSELPRSVIDDGFGINIPADSTDPDWARIPCAGVLDTSKIIDYPTDATLQQYIKDSMCGNGRATFTFSDEMAPLK